MDPNKAPEHPSNMSMQNKIKSYRQKRMRGIYHPGTTYSSIKDPRGPMKEKVHAYLDVDDMPHVVRRATHVQELLRDDVFGLGAYDAPGLVCPLKFHLIRSATELKKSELDACFSFVEMTSVHHYRTSSIGWHPNLKRVEMLDKAMMYLLIRQGDVGAAAPEPAQGESQAEAPRAEQTFAHLNPLEQIIHGYASDSEEDVDDTMDEPQGKVEEQTIDEPKANIESAPVPAAEAVSYKLSAESMAARRPRKELEWPDPRNNGRILGFLSFMFTNDDPPHEDREVAYIYEIHLHKNLRGNGLGSTLINFVERAALHCGITKTMLTVFTANKRARGMYEKLGYVKDKCSPKDRVTRGRVIEFDYLIMSKELLNKEPLN